MSKDISNTNANQEKTYFNVITTGLGYINDVRVIDPKKFGGKGDQYISLRIAALQGESNDVNYLRFNANVVGAAAIDTVMNKILPALAAAEENGKEPSDVKILASFSLGDVEPKVFTYEKGDRKGETGVAMQGRLLSFKSLKMDGEAVELEAHNSDDTTDNGGDNKQPAS